RVQRLLPALGQQLAATFASQHVTAWKGTRCVSSDRLPLVGPVNDANYPGLWICAGMGSRGLSFSVLCAELLAAQWGGEPWAIEARLARSLTALRSTSPASGPMSPA
ncbi:MAG: FAD-dependent oxidoreductase, partial [Rhodoferax sp.]|nr:FAD-dependent oxidoreductase [Rhodoferax sp.]